MICFSFLILRVVSLLKTLDSCLFRAFPIGRLEAFTPWLNVAAYPVYLT